MSCLRIEMKQYSVLNEGVTNGLINYLLRLVLKVKVPYSW